jgi:hypothetical protein
MSDMQLYSDTKYQPVFGEIYPPDFLVDDECMLPDTSHSFSTLSTISDQMPGSIQWAYAAFKGSLSVSCELSNMLYENLEKLTQIKRNKAAISLLSCWLSGKQQEEYDDNLDELIRALESDRLSRRKLFR